MVYLSVVEGPGERCRPLVYWEKSEEAHEGEREERIGPSEEECWNGELEALLPWPAP